MDTPLLATKLFIPEAQPGLVARPRLMKCLEGALNHRLMLVTGPPGFGKTTILSQWTRQYKLRAAWISLDEGDNNISRFCNYFLGAVQQLVPGAGEATRSMLGSAEPTNEVVWTALINDLAGAKDDLLIVMDDFHLVTDEPVCSALTYLIEHLPPKVHLLIASRVDPPLPLARFRGRGTMVEIGADDLRLPTKRPRGSYGKGKATWLPKTSLPSTPVPKAGRSGSNWPPCLCRHGAKSKTSSPASPGASAT
jgi:LuxR family maltose regulon positive regulatory protein